MEKPDYQTATPESVWAAIRESNRFLTEKQAETDRLIKESELERKKSAADFDRRLKESERERKESSADFDRRLKESAADFDRLIKESERERKKSSADFERRWEKIEKLTGGWAQNHGAFAEDYFFNAFENGQRTFFGEKFDEIEKNLKSAKPVKDEYDIVFFNGRSVGIIEVKYKAHQKDIPLIIRKAETFRANYPCYAHHQVYLGLASMAFYSELEDDCISQGIAIVKQVGDTMVINDANLRAF